jgi:16S rRNA (adenine1518-N6/adenine1519-N6)-dimethyltransferase
MDIFVDPRPVLKRHGLRPKRSWGQNFLVSAAAVEHIARLCVDRPDRRVIEIGAGPGTLTQALLALGARVTAVERDREMCRVLEAEGGEVPGFTLAEADAAAFDYQALLAAEPAVVAGNLPYQITGRILRRVLESETQPLRSVFTVQAEVADRLVAGPGDRARGALSVMVEARCEARISRRLPATAFSPRPKVRSAVVELVPRATPLFEDLDAAQFDTAVKAAFTGRRKTLRNSLLTSGWADRETVDDILDASGIDPGIRAERLDAKTLVALARAGESK